MSQDLRHAMRDHCLFLKEEVSEVMLAEGTTINGHPEETDEPEPYKLTYGDSVHEVKVVQRLIVLGPAGPLRLYGCQPSTPP